jgi:Ca2+-transporting ATPase
VEPIKIVDKVEHKLNFDHTPVEMDWHTYKLLKTSGSATESGIIKYVYPFNSEPMDLWRDKNPIIQEELSGSTIKLEIPFDSKYKYQASVHRMADKLLVVCKGAPDRVVDMCCSINNNGEMKAVDQTVKNEIMSANENFASNGRRVLAFSYYEVPLGNENQFFKELTLADGSKKWVANIELKDKLILAGLFALEDPARVEVPPAVKACHGAGVRVIMVTGDHKLTAQAIARDIGILTSDPEKLHENKVVSGDELSEKLASVRADPNVDPKNVEQIVIDWVTEFVER